MDCRGNKQNVISRHSGLPASHVETLLLADRWTTPTWRSIRPPPRQKRWVGVGKQTSTKTPAAGRDEIEKCRDNMCAGRNGLSDPPVEGWGALCVRVIYCVVIGWCVPVSTWGPIFGLPGRLWFVLHKLRSESDRAVAPHGIAMCGLCAIRAKGLSLVALCAPTEKTHE